MQDWNFSEYSKETAQELSRFLPDNIFDAHAHPGKKSMCDTERITALKELPEDIRVSAWREFTSLITGKNRLKGGLFFALPLFEENADIRKSCIDTNSLLISDLSLSGESDSKCSLLVSPLMQPEDVEEHLKTGQIAGFKPYMNLAPGCDINSDIFDFVPKWSLEMANENELAVTLHIQKYAALNDPDNIEQVHEICADYPKLKLILAHCGCSFNVYNTLKGAVHYTDIDNLYFDTSAVCEGIALTHMLKLFPAEKFMWGTDFPISVRNGRFVGLGNGVFSLQNNTVQGGRLPENLKLMCHGLESLRAFVFAAIEAGLSDKQMEDIFFYNAAKLLGL